MLLKDVCPFLCKKIYCISMIYVLLTQNFIVRIYAIFPQIILDWKAKSADIFTFWMYDSTLCIKLHIMFKHIFHKLWSRNCALCVYCACIHSNYMYFCTYFLILYTICTIYTQCAISRHSFWRRLWNICEFAVMIYAVLLQANFVANLRTFV